MWVFYLSYDARMTAVGNLNVSGPTESPVWNNGATPWEETITPASADTNKLAQLWMVSSGANKRITESPDTSSLKFATAMSKWQIAYLLLLLHKWLKIKLCYLAHRRRPPRAIITGPDKAANASLTPFASEKPLPHKMSEERSISAAINPSFPWARRPTASTTPGLGVKSRNWNNIIFLVFIIYKRQ